MKVEAETKNKDFNPVVISITLDSQDEVNMFKDIFNNHMAGSLCKTTLAGLRYYNSKPHLGFAAKLLGNLTSILKRY